MMRFDIFLIIACFMFSTFAYADLLDSAKLSGFIDSYYAYDFNRPLDRERQYTTQPVRHNEFNVNLAFIDLTVNTDKRRGRLALQTGNSVTKNYAGEPTIGATSGPQDSKYLQEAFAGVKIGEKTWVDAGIFLGNIGMESWISRENMTYSRSMMLDYVPYYSSGVRFEHFLSEKESFQFQILNGWQNISENNNGKAIGMQYKNKLSDHFTFTYNNFLGDEKVYAPQKSRFRSYHDFIFQYHNGGAYHWLASVDVGEQSQQDKSGQEVWYAAALVMKRVLDEAHSFSVRAEHYNDRHQSNVFTGTNNGFQVTGFSTNYDVKLDTNVLFRTEARTLISKDAIYPGQSRNKYVDTFLVTSLAITL